jgi:CDP-diacylglycerol pyrophosphatase
MLLCSAGTFAPAPATANPSALWEIVSTCVDRERTGYCTCPAFARSCCGLETTRDPDVVWARTDEFVAIRDMVMCGCPKGFVAGLALPRTRVSGIEDPRRPEAIWLFAWRVAHSRIRDEMEIALAINPKDARTQDQMHVHLLRLDSDGRAALEGPPPAGTIVLPLEDLDAVFAAAIARVGADRIGDHGILVARRKSGGWIALVTDHSSPQAFTINGCRPSAPGAPPVS